MVERRGGEITMRVRLAADDAWVRERLTARWGTTVVACVSGLHLELEVRRGGDGWPGGG